MIAFTHERAIVNGVTLHYVTSARAASWRGV
jgi:hypothetical protein